MAKAVNLSVDVSVELAERLKQRAAANGRSLQSELVTILEEAVRVLPLDDLAAMARRLGIRGEDGESVRMIREDRDEPHR